MELGSEGSGDQRQLVLWAQKPSFARRKTSPGCVVCTSILQQLGENLGMPPQNRSGALKTLQSLKS